MNVQVTFKTDFFQPLLHEEYSTNPECFGLALAQWLKQQLQQHGIPSEPLIAEDFGWVIMLARQPAMLWLGCGNIEGSTTEWTIFLVSEKTLLQRFQQLFKKQSTNPNFQTLWQQVQEIVVTIPAVQHIESIK